MAGPERHESGFAVLAREGNRMDSNFKKGAWKEDGPRRSGHCPSALPGWARIFAAFHRGPWRSCAGFAIGEFAEAPLVGGRNCHILKPRKICYGKLGIRGAFAGALCCFAAEAEAVGVIK